MDHSIDKSAKLCTLASGAHTQNTTADIPTDSISITDASKVRSLALYLSKQIQPWGVLHYSLACEIAGKLHHSCIDGEYPIQEPHDTEDTWLKLFYATKLNLAKANGTLLFPTLALPLNSGCCILSAAQWPQQSGWHKRAGGKEHNGCKGVGGVDLCLDARPLLDGYWQKLCIFNGDLLHSITVMRGKGQRYCLKGKRQSHACVQKQWELRK